jgi:hypothetical protein
MPPSFDEFSASYLELLEKDSLWWPRMRLEMVKIAMSGLNACTGTRTGTTWTGKGTGTGAVEAPKSPYKYGYYIPYLTSFITTHEK